MRSETIYKNFRILVRDWLNNNGRSECLMLFMIDNCLTGNFKQIIDEEMNKVK